MITLLLSALLTAGGMQEAVSPPVFEQIENSRQIVLYAVRPGGDLGEKIRSYEKNDLILLKSYLLDQGSYFFDKTKTCLFVPEYALKIPGSDDLIVLISPSGKQLKFQFDGFSKILDYDPAAIEMNKLILSRS